jgi:hypothetical protein
MRRDYPAPRFEFCSARPGRAANADRVDPLYCSSQDAHSFRWYLGWMDVFSFPVFLIFLFPNWILGNSWVDSASGLES